MYFEPYQSMIYGTFTVADLIAQYPPILERAGRYAFCTDRPGGAGMMICDGLQWVPDDTNVIAPPTSRSIVLGQAYQATDSKAPAIITVNVMSTSSNSLLAATQASQKMELLIGATAAAVTGGTGMKVGNYENTQGGVLVVGLTITQGQSQQMVAALPIGWYFGVRQTLGSNGSIVSAYDQLLG